MSTKQPATPEQLADLPAAIADAGVQQVCERTLDVAVRAHLARRHQRAPSSEPDSICWKISFVRAAGCVLRSLYCFSARRICASD